MKLKYKILIAVCILFAVIIVCFFSFRNAVLHYYVNKKINSFNQRYPAELKIGDSYFYGLLGITLKDIKIIPTNNDTLLKVNSMSSKLLLFPLITGNMKLSNLELDDSYISLVKQDSIDNYSFLLKRKKKSEENIDPTKSYAEQLNAILDAAFDKIPASITMHNFNISARSNSKYILFNMHNFDITDHKFITMVSVDEDTLHSNLTIEGNINSSERTAGLKIYSAEKNKKVIVPYIKSKFDFKVLFDTAQIQLAENSFNDTTLSVQGSASINGLMVNNRRIAKTDVQLDKGSINYKLIIGSNYFELDSSTSVSYNKLTFHPYARFRPKPTKQLTIKINKENFSAQDFFNSLPNGLFTNLDGIKVEGTLSYHLNFFIDTKEPDSLDFSSDLIPTDFKISKFGATDLRMINGPFQYTVYENDNPISSFIVGPENNDFVPLENIPKILRSCIMISEDLGFYYHRGFYPEAFKLAIAQNIKEKRFVRGASTLSMQLVKNVFLSRNKTIVRKLEEILITWLIEYNNLSSKDRMFEVYLNIIEWGPGIWGINQASRFYFNKKPTQLSVSECIFLTSIIPHPKWFVSSFDEDGHLLQDYLFDYYKIVSEKLLTDGIITQKEFDNTVPDVELKGRAKLLLQKRNENLNVDSLMQNLNINLN